MNELFISPNLHGKQSAVPIIQDLGNLFSIEPDPDLISKITFSNWKTFINEKLSSNETSNEEKIILLRLQGSLFKLEELQQTPFEIKTRDDVASFNYQLPESLWRSMAVNGTKSKVNQSFFGK